MNRTFTPLGTSAGLEPVAKVRPGWLSGLYKAQAIADSGVRMTVLHESLLRGAGPACAAGCTGCCKRRESVGTSLELAGALWFVENSDPGSLEKVLHMLDTGAPGCPFLLDGACSVHPMRPLACRQLVVFARPCAPGEDPARSRPGDLLTPLAGHVVRAASVLDAVCLASGLPTDRKPLRSLHRAANGLPSLAA